MLKHQSELSLSPHSELYDILIPKDDELRRLNELVDFSFIYQELIDKYCLGEGRTAVDPVQMFKYLYLKVRFNLSDRDLVVRARTDMAMKFFLGLNPEDPVISPSLLTKFRRQRLKDTDLLQKLLAKTVQIAIDQGVLKSKTIIVDATHTTSRFNQKSPVEALRNGSRILRKHLYQANPQIKTQLPEKNTLNDLNKERQYTRKLIQTVKAHPEVSQVRGVPEALHSLEELDDDINEQTQCSTDQDAKLGHKSKDTAFFGYKTHLGMTTDRIITAAIVTSGEKGDGQFLEDLIEQTKANGVNVEAVIGDRAYSGKQNLELADQKGITLYSRLNPVISNGSRQTKQTWDYNKDAGMFVCPAGNMAIRKARTGKKNQAKNQARTYYFDIEKCRQCPLQEGCYTPGAKAKTYSVTIKSEPHQKQLAFQNTEIFQETVKLRYRIEAKNAEIKTKHGYRISWSNDIEAMKLQGAMTLFYANMERIMKLMSNK